MTKTALCVCVCICLNDHVDIFWPSFDSSVYACMAKKTKIHPHIFFFVVTLQGNHKPLGLFRLDDRERERENKHGEGGEGIYRFLARHE